MTPQAKASQVWIAASVAASPISNREFVRRIALIIVDEIIKANPGNSSTLPLGSPYQYWQQVKEELQKP